MGFSGGAGAGDLVQAFGLNEGKGHFPVQESVLGQVDLLLATLAEVLLDMIAAVGEGGGLVGKRSFSRGRNRWRHPGSGNIYATNRCSATVTEARPGWEFIAAV